MFASALRSLAVMVMSPESPAWTFTETGLRPVFLLTGSLVLFLLGLLPQSYMPLLTNLASIFIFQGP
jgi:hypothetical protein